MASGWTWTGRRRPWRDCGRRRRSTRGRLTSGPLEISITPGRGAGVDLATAEKFAALGVHRLILMPSPRLDGAGLERYVDEVGTRLVGKV